MISVPGSLSFVMSSAPARDARYESQEQATLSHTISTPIRIRSAFFLRRTQQPDLIPRVLSLPTGKEVVAQLHAEERRPWERGWRILELRFPFN